MRSRQESAESAVADVASSHRFDRAVSAALLLVVFPFVAFYLVAAAAAGAAGEAMGWVRGVLRGGGSK